MTASNLAAIIQWLILPLPVACEHLLINPLRE